jgi:hypothetical protein
MDISLVNIWPEERSSSMHRKLLKMIKAGFTVLRQFATQLLQWDFGHQKCSSACIAKRLKSVKKVQLLAWMPSFYLFSERKENINHTLFINLPRQNNCLLTRTYLDYNKKVLFFLCKFTVLQINIGGTINDRKVCWSKAPVYPHPVYLPSNKLSNGDHYKFIFILLRIHSTTDIAEQL